MQTFLNAQKKPGSVLSGVCLLSLDSGDMALFINGDYITERKYTPDIHEQARLTATALGRVLHVLELSAPDFDWCWDDVIQLIEESEVRQDVRRNVTVLVSKLDNGKGFHFCNHPVLSGCDANLWFPLEDDESLFKAVEKVMAMNHVAVNIVRLDPIREYQNGQDIDVVYNVKLGSVKTIGLQNASSVESEKVAESDLSKEGEPDMKGHCHLVDGLLGFARGVENGSENVTSEQAERLITVTETVLFYALKKGLTQSGEETATAITDLIADIMHLGYHCGIGEKQFTDILKRACMHVETELAEQEGRED